MSAKKKCCCNSVCSTCCLRVTFTGVTLFTSGVYEQVDGLFESHFDEIEGSINGVGFIVCLNEISGDSIIGQAYVPVAVKTHTEDVGGSEVRSTACGYLRLSAGVTSGGILGISLVNTEGSAEETVNPFLGSVNVGADVLAYLNLPQCPDEYPSTGATITNEVEAEQYFANGDGTAYVEIVPTCNGENPVFSGPDCETADIWGQTICDEDDCPCGRTSEQPTCLLVTIKGSDGVDSVYQNNSVISGAGGRNYVFAGPYRRDDGTWWRFLAVADNPTAATFGGDCAYFVHQCPGDHLDSYSGTWTYEDPDNWDTTPSDAQDALAHQTALTGIGSTATVAACVCDLADDYVSRILCGDGDPPDGEVTIELVQGDTPCNLVGDNGTYSEVLEWDDGTWTQTVTRNSDSVVVFTASWSGASNDPTGSHLFDASIWDDDPCTSEPGSLRSEIE